MDREALAGELGAIVGAEHVCVDAAEIARRTRNTLGLERGVLGLVYPQTTKQVQAIVALANRRRLALYPYSTAKNIGYGERLPVSEDNLIVDLGRMDRILAIDAEQGFADVEPGVTQGRLSDALREQGIPFFVDVTGSGRDSSLVGNCVEGGFGTTPKGDRRKQITCLKGVLGSGELFDTGSFPGSLGPDLAGAFVQSNFGIVTQLRIPLNAVFAAYESFTISLASASDLVGLVEVLRGLRQQGSIVNQVVIMNALDALYTSGTAVPEAYANRLLSNAEAAEILSTPLSRFGEIAAIGAIYGSREEVRARRRTLRRALRSRLAGRARILFMGDRKLALLKRLFGAWPLSRLPLTAGFSEVLESYRATHGLMQGIPSDVALIGLMGSVRDTYEDTRLMWYSSRISSRSQDVARFVEIAARCYAQQGFACPLEMLLVTANDIVAIQKVDWKLGDSDEEQRARKLYASLGEQLSAAGFLPYRLGVQSQAAVEYPEQRGQLLQRLKQAFDPAGVISPGRYGIR